ncbi:hypothetical protein PsorP6_002396 [Peronosclerospora sorghi]|uniref:Uncharacterized protein n=1 Tax=Peronosclerospora sorghi TaxID=230839 RepID=A0ACC0WUX0_9STRA|nr:hypothetical protein PsorP6_002396 [Peronosclerospora sorghi]
MHNRIANGRATKRELLFSGSSTRSQNGVDVDNGEQAKRLLEEQNDEQISHLSLQITQLKQSPALLTFCGCIISLQLTSGIHAEVVDQNNFLDGMVSFKS